MVIYNNELPLYCDHYLISYNKIPTLWSMTDAKQWTRKQRSSSNWHYLSAREVDDGKRWSIIWDVERKPGVEDRNTALEKHETGALDRARHMLRMGFIVYEIREPSGSVFLEEAGLRQRFGYTVAAM